MAASSTSDWRTLNEASWDERTAAHLGPRGHDRSSHRAGLGALDAIVDAELGPVAGLSVLHLQCHIGDDTVAIAQRGAGRVVGLDVSPRPLAFDNPADCADPEARLATSRTVEVLHPLSDILGALRGAGLVLDWLHEHPRLPWQLVSCLVRDPDGFWTWRDKPWLPRAVSLSAIRKD